MNEYANEIKENLNSLLLEMDKNSYLFTKHPEKDFTRKRKLDFKEMLRILLSMGGNSLKLELMNHFSYDVETATSSAFLQQREKILPDALQFLFHEFITSTALTAGYNGYRLLAVDGSDLCIPHNPEDKETYFPNREKAKGFNLLHLNAMYDLCNRVYVDALVQTARKADERQGLTDMVDRCAITERTIVIADRGYESYNVFTHIARKGWNYVIRVKDKNSNGIVSGLSLPDGDSFDKDYYFLLTRRQTNDIKARPGQYKFIAATHRFDYLPVGEKETYPIHFRVVRFPISDNEFEVIITNLSAEEFPAAKIKEIYHMRWGIETSFRELKYAIGLTNFHSKKVAYVTQEIFARLTMYNFCEIITTHVIVEQKDRKHIYQVNFTIAIAICLHYFKCRGDTSPPNVEALIRKNILPIRPGRKDTRKVKAKSSVSFLYRVA